MYAVKPQLHAWRPLPQQAEEQEAGAHRQSKVDQGGGCARRVLRALALLVLLAGVTGVAVVMVRNGETQSPGTTESTTTPGISGEGGGGSDDNPNKNVVGHGTGTILLGEEVGPEAVHDAPPIEVEVDEEDGGDDDHADEDNNAHDPLAPVVEDEPHVDDPPVTSEKSGGGGGGTGTLLDQLETNCPNWSRAFRRQFATKCAHWVEVFTKWLGKERRHGKPLPPAAIFGCHTNDCPGLGDRFSGMTMVLSSAISASRPFRMAWPGFTPLFDSCVFKGRAFGDWSRAEPRNVAAAWAATERPLLEDDSAFPGCVQHDCGGESFRSMSFCTAESRCSAHREAVAKCTHPEGILFRRADTTCLPESFCAQDKEYFPQGMDAASAFGCPLRAMMEPSPAFLNWSVHFFANGSVHERTVGEIRRYLAHFYVIGIHMRTGDSSFKHGEGTLNPFQATNLGYMRPFMCAQTLESHLAWGGGGGGGDEAEAVHDLGSVLMHDAKSAKAEKFVNGKPVRYLFASDSEPYREFVRSLFGSKVLMMSNPPKHIMFESRLGPSDMILRNVLAEWIFLGNAEVILTNKHVAERKGVDGAMYAPDGRLSAYSKMALVYQLKSVFVDAHSCKLHELPWDGFTWGETADVCSNRKPAEKTHLPQPHLMGLRSAQRAFPKFWMHRGQPRTWVGGGD